MKIYGVYFLSVLFFSFPVYGMDPELETLPSTSLAISTSDNNASSRQGPVESQEKPLQQRKRYQLARTKQGEQEDQNYVHLSPCFCQTRDSLEQNLNSLKQASNTVYQLYNEQPQGYPSQQYIQPNCNSSLQQCTQSPYPTQSQQPHLNSTQMRQDDALRHPLLQACDSLEYKWQFLQQWRPLYPYCPLPQKKPCWILKNQYFHKDSTLYIGTDTQKISVHNQAFLGNSGLNHSKIIQTLSYGYVGADDRPLNHLICNIFCVASLDENNAPLFILESPIFAREQEDTFAKEHKKSLTYPGYHYNFSVKKPHMITSSDVIIPTSNNNGKIMADFVSCTSLGDEQWGRITIRRLLPITRNSTLKSTSEPEDTHGDQVALYTLQSNKHLFLKLITKHGHRSNYKIKAFGCRYFSTYDACDTCNDKIYNTRNSLQTGLNAILCEEGYKKTDQDHPIPFYNLFYSFLPYNGAHPAPVRYSLVPCGGSHEDTKIGFTFSGNTSFYKPSESYSLSTEVGQEILNSETGLCS